MCQQQTQTLAAANSNPNSSKFKPWQKQYQTLAAANLNPFALKLKEKFTDLPCSVNQEPSGKKIALILAYMCMLRIHSNL